MRLLKVFALYFVFCAEVRVHASELVTIPVHCWGKSYPCGAQNLHDEKIPVMIEKNKITFAPKTILKSLSANEYRLIDGKILIHGKRSTRISSLFAEAECTSHCKLIVEREADSVRVLALEGNALIHRLGDKKSYNLPQGFWVRLSGVLDDGKGIIDYPQSLPLQPTLKELATLFDGNWSEFRAEALRLKPLWTKAVDTASGWHFKEAKRTIASHEKEKARELAERRKRDAEDSRLRGIFRERNYFSQ